MNLVVALVAGIYLAIGFYVATIAKEIVEKRAANRYEFVDWMKFVAIVFWLPIAICYIVYDWLQEQ